MRSYSHILPALLSAVALAVPAQQADNTTLQGFNPEGLKALDAAMHSWVDKKNGASVVTLLARKGQIVHQDAYGKLASDASDPAKKDSIFRIASMTKPIVGVGMMMFYEEGKWKLEDLVSKHIPEFADLKVKLANGSLVPQSTQMTMSQLMSHSAGFPGELSVNSPTLDSIIPPLLRGQLAFQPGTDWRYGPGVEIQGYLIQKWANKDLSDFLEERLFKPMGLSDTGFFVDASKVNRVSKIHTTAGGTLSTTNSRVSTSKPTRLSPSGGLYSTAENYWEFCQMLLNGGEYKGKRYLKAESVKTMHTNVLAKNVKVKASGSSGDGIGFGMDFGIILDPKPTNNHMPKDSYYWGGMYGTWFWIDPVKDVIFVGMIQNQGAQQSGESSLRQQSAKLIYEALKA